MVIGHPVRWQAAAVGLLVLLTGLGGSVSATDRPLPKESKMAIDDKLFEQVQLGSGERSDCSPAEPSLPWHGVVVQAPKQVGFRLGRPVDGSFASIPICGFYRIKMERLLDGKPLTLVATNLKNHARHIGEMVDPEPGQLEPKPNARPLDPQSVKGMSIGGYFNVNLARYVTLPSEEAVYQVHVEYGGTVSNAVQIAVVRN